jgi:hypothetical protein
VFRRVQLVNRCILPHSGAERGERETKRAQQRQRPVPTVVCGHTPRWCTDGAYHLQGRVPFPAQAVGADALADAFPSPTTQRGPAARAPRSLRDVLAGFITTCTEAPETTQHVDNRMGQREGR